MNHVTKEQRGRLPDANVAVPEDVGGSATARREFQHADDMADALIYLMPVGRGTRRDGPMLGVPNAINEIANIGQGHEFSVGEPAAIVREVVGETGSLTFDAPHA